MFEALDSGGCSFGEILVSSGIGPFDCAPVRKVGKLTGPIQDLPRFFRRKCPDDTD
jgi:hypothetical protein